MSELETPLQQAIALYKAGYSMAALSMIEALLPSIPSAELINMAGVCAYHLKQLDKAENYWQQTITDYPSTIVAYNNLALLFQAQGLLDKALAVYRQALLANPKNADISYTLGKLLLKQGHYIEGWHYYCKESSTSVPKFPFPKWQGENPKGKSFVIWKAETLDEQLLLIRFTQHLKLLGASRISVMCENEIAPLLQKQKGIDTVVIKGTRQPVHDYWMYLQDIPNYLKITLDNIPNESYLSIAPKAIERWQSALPQAAFKVGLAWQSSTMKPTEKPKAIINLQSFLPLWQQNSNICFINLQSTPPQTIANQPILDLSEQINNLEDTAAIINQLDLVICVDSAIAHLTGALGKPCWVLLPMAHTHWSWLQQRTDSPWYPKNVVLFHQQTAHHWKDVIDLLAQKLQTAIKAKYTQIYQTILSLNNTKAYQAALQAFELLPVLNRDFPILNIAAHCATALERWADAERYWQQAARIRPHSVNTYDQISVMQINQQHYAEAIVTCKKVLSMMPKYATAQFNLAYSYAMLKQYTNAELAYKQALKIQPDFIEAQNNLAQLFYIQERFEDAKKTYQHLLTHQPTYADAYYNLGNILKAEMHLDEAETAYRQAITYNKNHANAYNNLANLLRDKGCLLEAESLFKQTLHIQPEFTDAQFNFSLLLLEQGKYTEGWPLHETRYSSKRSSVTSLMPNLPYPQWQSEPLKGKRIIILHEQGHGDDIQFIRYATCLKQQGAMYVSMLCKPPLTQLLLTHHAIDAIYTDINNLPEHDFWVFTLSLPYHCQTTLTNIPVSIPYLHALPERINYWQPFLSSPKKVKVGLVWQGSAGHKNDTHRSLPHLNLLAPLWEVPNVQFISLQKGQGEAQAKHPPEQQPLLHLGSDMQDFADAAAIIQQLDLVICVDTAIAHLTGALGKPCWILLPAIGSDWRWLQERQDSPWYPKLTRLFRQKTAGQWHNTILEVQQVLLLFTQTVAETSV